MVEFTRTSRKMGKAWPEARTAAIKLSVVRQERILVEFHAAGVTGTSRVATLRIDGVALDNVTVQAIGAVVLEADVLETAIGSVSVDLAVDGEPAPLNEGKEHSLPGLVTADFEAFRVNVVRKGFRTDVSETLVEVVRPSYINCIDNLLIRAVSLAVGEYCYVETLSGSSYADVEWVEEAGNQLHQSVDESIAEKAQCVTSTDMILYQNFVMGTQLGMVLLYPYRLYAGSHLVDVEPMCAYNLRIGIYLIGYLNDVAGRYAEAAIIWAEDEYLVVKAVNRQRKSGGTMLELGTVWKSSFACVSGQTAAIRFAP